MYVLVVEDDPALGLFLQKGLQLDGHDVDWVEDGERALESAENRPPDLIVLDLGLPRRDGTEVLEDVQARWPETSVLVLTGRLHMEDRLRCFRAGADDFLLKPFSFHELSARCRAILRRRSQASGAVLKFGDIAMNRLQRTVHRGGVEIDLTAKEFSLLEFLLSRRGEICDRAELLREVWQMPADAGTNVVDVYVNYLRKKLAPVQDEGIALPTIETVRGRGYRLATPMTMVRRPNLSVGQLPMAKGA